MDLVHESKKMLAEAAKDAACQIIPAA